MNNTEIKEEQILYMDLYEKLKSMKFSGMAEELRIQLENPNSDLESFQNRFEKLVTAEWNLRYNKKFERYLKKAKLKIPGAAFDEKLYDPDRQLDIPTIEKLNTCTWMNIPWWRSHPIHENRATESICTEPCNPLLRATKSMKRATSTY